MLHIINNIVFYTNGDHISGQNTQRSWEVVCRHVFTSMRIKSRKALFLKSHIKRLLLGADYIFAEHTINSSLNEEILQGIDKIQDYFLGEFRIKVVLTPKLTIMAREIKEGYSCHSAINLTRAQEKKATLRPSFLKVDDYKKSIEEITHIQKKGYDDILYLDRTGNIMECSSSNIFFVLKNKIYTPRLKPGILAGITRQKLIDCLKEKKIPVHCLDISWSQLYGADEIWQTNSIKGIRPVKMLEDKTLTRFQSKNSLTSKVTRLFKNYCRADDE